MPPAVAFVDAPRASVAWRGGGFVHSSWRAPPPRARVRAAAAGGGLLRVHALTAALDALHWRACAAHAPSDSSVSSAGPHWDKRRALLPGGAAALLNASSAEVRGSAIERLELVVGAADGGALHSDCYVALAGGLFWNP